MSANIPAREVVVGDYSPAYGTVKQVKKHNGDKTEITFVNGLTISPDNEMELEIDQGGRF